MIIAAVIVLGFVFYFTNIDEQDERDAKERAQIEETQR